MTESNVESHLLQTLRPPDVLELRDMPTPEPRPNEVLIRVHTATVTMGDAEVRAFRLPGWVWVPARLAIGIVRPWQPILGMEIAGEIAEVGNKVSRFRVGDRVFGHTGFRMGAYAEFAAVPESAPLTLLPPALSYAEAVGISTGGLNGLHFIRKSAPQRGEQVLINGAGGSIGMFAVQLAKAAGAEVTGIDRAAKHEMLRSIGADHVIDYQQQDFWASGRRYDVIIDVVGTSPFAATVKALNDGGRYFLGNPRAGQMLRALIENRRKRVQVLFQFAGERLSDLEFLKQQVADGSLKVIIDRHYRLEDVPEAHRYVESGAKTGVVVIDVGSTPPADST